MKTGLLLNKDAAAAKNSDMVRVDVFEKGGKYYLVPIYSWQVAKGILPDRAIVQRKDEEDWQLIDDSFNFKFPLHPNDLVEVITKKLEYLVTLLAVIEVQVILISVSTI